MPISKKPKKAVPVLTARQQEVRRYMLSLHNSCVEGITGEWDCRREGFEAMIEALEQVHDLVGLEWLPGRKEVPDD